MTGNNGGPWGGGNRGNRGNGKRPADETPQIPEIDELVKKGQEQLRVMLGGAQRWNGRWLRSRRAGWSYIYQRNYWPCGIGCFCFVGDGQFLYRQTRRTIG